MDFMQDGELLGRPSFKIDLTEDSMAVACEEERIVALPGYFAVRAVETGEETTVRGIVLPGNRQKDPTVRAEILCYGGPGPQEPDLNKHGVKAGHTCIISKFAGVVATINDGEEVLLVRQSEVMGLVGSD
jgi:co-chaperonin GroES (HSP10)